jgi:hypothetical protein
VLNKLSYTDREYCNSCLISLLKKRIKKVFRKKGIPILILKKENSLEFDFALFFLKELFPREDIKVLSSGLNPSSLDEQALLLLESFINNKPVEKKPHFPENILIEEMELLKDHIKSKNKPRFKNNKMLNELKNNYPDVLFSIFQSKLFLETKNFL